MRQYNQINPAFQFNGREYSVKNVSTCIAKTCCVLSACVHPSMVHAHTRTQRAANAIFEKHKKNRKFNDGAYSESEQGNLACVIFINFFLPFRFAIAFQFIGRAWRTGAASVGNPTLVVLPSRLHPERRFQFNGNQWPPMQTTDRMAE